MPIETREEKKRKRSEDLTSGAGSSGISETSASVSSATASSPSMLEPASASSTSDSCSLEMSSSSYSTLRDLGRFLDVPPDVLFRLVDIANDSFGSPREVSDGEKGRLTEGKFDGVHARDRRGDIYRCNGAEAEEAVPRRRQRQIDNKNAATWRSKIIIKPRFRG